MSDNAQPPSEFGARLRKYRKKTGLSLLALAERADLSKGYLSSLENSHEPRRPSAEVLYTLAKALGVTMSDLMGRQSLPTWHEAELTVLRSAISGIHGPCSIDRCDFEDDGTCHDCNQPLPCPTLQALE